MKLRSEQHWIVGWLQPEQSRWRYYVQPGPILVMATFHSSNDNRMFNTHYLYTLVSLVIYIINHKFHVEYMTRLFSVTATFILQVMTNALGELPNCSYRYFAF